MNEKGRLLEGIEPSFVAYQASAFTIKLRRNLVSIIFKSTLRGVVSDCREMLDVEVMVRPYKTATPIPSY